VQEKSPQNFKTPISIPQLGRRKAYYLVSIDKAFGDKNVAPGRLKKVGWTKLAALAPHIRQQRLEDRRAELQRIVKGADAILFSESIEAEGALVFAEACEMGCGGIVSKRIGSIYRSRRCRNRTKARKRG